MKKLGLMLFLLSLLQTTQAQEKLWYLGGAFHTKQALGLNLELGYLTADLSVSSGEWISLGFPERSWGWTLSLGPSYLPSEQNWLAWAELGYMYQDFPFVLGWTAGLRLGAVRNFNLNLNQIYAKPVLGLSFLGVFFAEYGYALPLFHRELDLGLSRHQLQFGLRWPLE